ncbi:unnamed protein product [Vitrella brassicaformis CCMP3155]|uniref:Uncharacterized protein n=1 Tax=Vitrella brassicaformis (strain CCMP3155) TaxID=1169540 RepID=A0A0G4EAE3_VITBC|nr:unnamed protein product [Vitrella brassicaformis CCMP3155]|eukprot:CEL92217.1 unnamed protein product [Vitrella brassicaformis CCMP3155]
MSPVSLPVDSPARPLPAHTSHSLMASGSVPSLWALSLNKASHMLDDPTKRPAFQTQIDKQPPTEIPKGVKLPAVLQQRVERAMHEEGLHDLLAFDIPDVAEALKTAYVLERCMTRASSSAAS